MGSAYYLKKVLVVFIVASLVLLVRQSGQKILTTATENNHRGRFYNKKLDLRRARDEFRNPVFASWAVKDKVQKISERSLSEKCNLYLEEIQDFHVDLDTWTSLKIDPLVYKEKKWTKERLRAEKKKYKRKDWKKEYEEEITREFAEASSLYANYENRIFDEVNHMRVYGKCVPEISDSLCHKFQKQLYPWMLDLPKVKDAQGIVVKTQKKKKNNSNSLVSKCLINQLLETDDSQGIIIPILNGETRRSVGNIERALKSLRYLGSKLPVAITFTALPEEEKKRLVNAATVDADQYSPMQLYFVDLSPVTKYDLDITTLSLSFSPFEDTVLLSEHSILLTEPQNLFNAVKYKSGGAYFFKHPSILNKVKATPGFYEIGHFVKNIISPSGGDLEYFNLQRQTSCASRRYFDEDFKTAIDANLMVVNKRKALNGLLMSLSLEFYKVLNLRLKKPDTIWIGQELAGTNVAFHHNYPVMAGVYSPQADSEICSASYAQLSDTDDVTLISTTSHQLQNWLRNNYSFKAAFDKKYVRKYTEYVDNIFVTLPTSSTLTLGAAAAKTSMDRLDYTLFKKLLKNPSLIENVIIPPILKTKVNVKTFEEQSEAWIEQKDHISERAKQASHKYYCAYSTVGDPLDGGDRGLTINVSRQKQEFYSNVTAVWLRGRP
ncbi:uncharacterized protein LODBEIA_P16450 [Lodderomyces beijingensis]|uniref:Alpha-1,3-mannosyltransferase n=1 Tax=Lodderomyces beijingensis TaxID=1775926 RepID=A0ABP0ZGX9_9ASCO